MNKVVGYLPYFLTDNPFPSDPSFNKDSVNKRVNGTIFDEEIFKDELDKLYKLMKRRMNLIYCQNIADYARGVGKSSLIAHAWRTLEQSGEDVSSVFIRCQRKSTPNSLCAETISEWHRQGLLWKTLLNCVQRYVDSESSPEIAASGARLLSERKWPVDSVDLRSYLVYNPTRLISALARWATSQAKFLTYDFALAFFGCYLIAPQSFLMEYPKTRRKTRSDEIDQLRNLLELLELGGIKYHYLFFDQFEDPLHGLAGKDLLTFSSGMRRILETGNERMTIIVTLHPDAVLTLNLPDSQEFITLAPLDSRHRVDVEMLTPEDAKVLATTYLNAYRTGASPNSLYPFSPEAVTQISEVSQGQIRSILTGLYLAIEEGIEAGCPIIDIDFIQKKHEEITGRIHPDSI